MFALLDVLDVFPLLICIFIVLYMILHLTAKKKVTTLFKKNLATFEV